MLDTFLVNEMARSLIRQSSWRSVNWDDCAYEFWWVLDFVTTSYAKFFDIWIFCGLNRWNSDISCYRKKTVLFAHVIHACYESAGSSKQRRIAAEIRKFGKAKKTPNVFKYQELADATENFNPDCLVGEGGYGRVYKGYIEAVDQVSLSIWSWWNIAYAHTCFKTIFESHSLFHFFRLWL